MKSCIFLSKRFSFFLDPVLASKTPSQRRAENTDADFIVPAAIH